MSGVASTCWWCACYAEPAAFGRRAQDAGGRVLALAAGLLARRQEKRPVLRAAQDRPRRGLARPHGALAGGRRRGGPRRLLRQLWYAPRAAGQRARGILKGDLPTIERDNDKNPVIALREIAAQTIDFEMLNDGLIKKLQRISIREEQETYDDAALAAEVDLSEMVGDYNMDEAEANGMRITTADEKPEPSGFEDVDLSEIQNED